MPGLLFGEDGQYIFNVDKLETTPIMDDSREIGMFPDAMTFEFTATCNFNRNYMHILCGTDYMVPNNWLKMHGYPMRRKAK